MLIEATSLSPVATVPKLPLRISLFCERFSWAKLYTFWHLLFWQTLYMNFFLGLCIKHCIHLSWWTLFSCRLNREVRSDHQWSLETCWRYVCKCEWTDWTCDRAVYWWLDHPGQMLISLLRKASNISSVLAWSFSRMDDEGWTEIVLKQ